MALALVIANVVIMSIRWGYLLSGAGYRDRPLEALLDGRGRPRGEQHPPRARRRPPSHRVDAGAAACRCSSPRGRSSPSGCWTASSSRPGSSSARSRSARAAPMLLTGVALSSGAALGVGLVALAARDPDAAERFAWRATRTAAAPLAHALHPRGRALRRRAGRLPRAARGSSPSSGPRPRCGSLDVAMYWVVGEFAFGLDLPIGAYFLLEGIGNLALAVPATAAGIGTFDYLTLLAAKGIDVNPDKATAYVLTMHALAVLPGHDHGRDAGQPRLPAPAGQAARARPGIRLDLGSARSRTRGRGTAARAPCAARRRAPRPAGAAGRRRPQVGLHGPALLPCAARRRRRGRARARPGPPRRRPRAARRRPGRRSSGIVSRRSASRAPSTSSFGELDAARRARGGRACGRVTSGS